MAPIRTVTGDTLVTEKPGASVPLSPTSPTNADDFDQTLRGDAIIKVAEDDNYSRSRRSIESRSSGSDVAAQPRMSTRPPP